LIGNCELILLRNVPVIGPDTGSVGDARMNQELSWCKTEARIIIKMFDTNVSMQL
jgi:hypothetical protein